MIEGNVYPKYQGIPNFSQNQHLFTKLPVKNLEIHCQCGTKILSFVHNKFLYVVEIPPPLWGNQPLPIIDVKEV